MTDRQQTIFLGAGLGFLAGAAAGAVGGQAIGKDTKSTLIGAGIGALAAGIAGAVYGTHVADQKARFSSDEEYLKACILAADQASQQAEIYNAQLKGNISLLKQDVQQLVVKYNNHQVEIATMRKAKKRFQNDLAQLSINQQAIEEQIIKYNKAYTNSKNASSTSLASLESQINKLEKARQELGTQANALASIDQSIKI